MSGGNHVGLEQGALQVDVVVGQGLVDSSQDLLSNVLAALQVMVTIRENLRLDDGDDAVLRTAETKGVKMSVSMTGVGGLSKARHTVCYVLVSYCFSGS